MPDPVLSPRLGPLARRLSDVDPNDVSLWGRVVRFARGLYKSFVNPHGASELTLALILVALVVTSVVNKVSFRAALFHLPDYGLLITLVNITLYIPLFAAVTLWRKFKKHHPIPAARRVVPLLPPAILGA